MRAKHEVWHLVPWLPSSSQDPRCCHGPFLLACSLSPGSGNHSPGPLGLGVVMEHPQLPARSTTLSLVVLYTLPYLDKPPFYQNSSVEVCCGFLPGPSRCSPLLWRWFECMIQACSQQMLTEGLRDTMVNRTDQIPATRQLNEGSRK